MNGDHAPALLLLVIGGVSGFVVGLVVGIAVGVQL